MLSNDVPASPRPRPPAKARRSSSMQSLRSPLVPPPPYESRLDALIDSPIDATTQLLGTSTRDGGHSPTDEWMTEKSREDLSHLLVKADGIIKSRETELSVTSTLYKTLYHDNRALRNKHEALLARLPSPRILPAGSNGSPLAIPTPLCESPEYFGGSLPRTSGDDDIHFFPSPSHRHHRKISVTPSEIATLADQNAELLDKLEKLEADSVQADNLAKRKLKKLEKEIQGLKEELEVTQIKGAELEQKAKAVSPEVQRQRKEERELKARALRAKSGTNLDSVSLEDIKDFAPAPELPHSSTVKSLSELDAELSSAPTPQSEYAIVSQLLIKIKELEDANVQITEEQKTTAERLRAVQRDSDNIKRMYECLGSEANVQLQVVSDNTLLPNLNEGGHFAGTIRFSSLRKTLDARDITASLTSEESQVFATGISMQSTTRGNGLIHNGHSHKTRKTVVGLFDGPSSPELENDPLSLSVPMSLQPLPSTGFDVGDISTWSIAATDGVEPPSPTFSTLEVEERNPGHTLGSELGSEFGDDWGHNSGRHNRNNSLYNITGLSMSREPSESPSASPLILPSFLLPTPDGSPGSVLQDDSWENGSEVEYSPSLGAVPELQFLVDPPTPTRNERLGKTVMRASLREPAASRVHRLSETMRARTHRWVEGRFTPSPQTSVMRSVARRTRTRVSSHSSRGSEAATVMGEAFEAVVQQFARGRDADAESDPDNEHLALELHHSHGMREETSSTVQERRDGFVGLMVEVWLWLQFAIVVLVFLWAMAKRGPKSVLEEADRRRVSHRVVRR